MTELDIPGPASLETKAVWQSLAEAHRHLAELKGLCESLPNRAILLDTLAIQEAKDSSEIENIITTHDELYAYDQNCSASPAAKEVQNYIAALKVGFTDVVNSGLIRMSTILRTATRTDLTLILGFIRDLAAYEKLLDQVVADELILDRALFGRTPQAEVVIAEHDGQAAGFALFFHNFSTFRGRRGLYLEDLFVRPEFRGHGIGKALLQRLAAIAIERDCARFEWSVLDWNTSAIGFYESLGARVLPDWRVCRVDGEALIALASQN